MTKDEAERYLTKLDAGFVGRHFEAFREPISLVAPAAPAAALEARQQLVAQLLRVRSRCTAEVAEQAARRFCTEPQTLADFGYSRWRHGGWYVGCVRYPTGAIGCVSCKYPDKKWRFVCDTRDGDHTYSNRDAAARAEQELALTEYTPERVAKELSEIVEREREAVAVDEGRDAELAERIRAAEEGDGARADQSAPAAERAR